MTRHKLAIIAVGLALSLAAFLLAGPREAECCSRTEVRRQAAEPAWVTVELRVVDALSGRPVPDATVMVRGDGAIGATTTDARGNAVIRTPTTVRPRVTISAKGYAPTRREVPAREPTARATVRLVPGTPA